MFQLYFLIASISTEKPTTVTSQSSTSFSYIQKNRTAINTRTTTTTATKISTNNTLIEKTTSSTKSTQHSHFDLDDYFV